MMKRFSAICLISIALCTSAFAQKHQDARSSHTDSVAFFRGVAVSADIVGPLQLYLGNYGQYEAALRVNLKDKFFPVLELGYGKADAEDAVTTITYKTSAPYGRVGMDFNLMKNKHDLYRVYGGLRYAYTNYKFDFHSPKVTDPAWREDMEFGVKDVSCNYHWMEIVFGIDAKIYGPVRLGWSARYKRRLFHNDGGYGRPWYVPGYGKQGNMRLGGTFNIIIEF